MGSINKREDATEQIWFHARRKELHFGVAGRVDLLGVKFSNI